MDSKLIVIAIGGNSLIEDPKKVTVDAQYRAAEKTAHHIVLSNPSLTSRNKALEEQLDILRSWSKERKALKKKYKEDLDAVNKSHIDAMRKSGR